MDTTDDTLLEEDARDFLTLVGMMKSIKDRRGKFLEKLGPDATDPYILRVVDRGAYIWGDRTAGGAAFWYSDMLEDAAKLGLFLPPR
jgi:hypothetical protein